MGKCLVTGATGFIGTHLVRALIERGDDVACLVRPRSQLGALEGLPIRVAPGDMTAAESLPAAMAGCDRVFHLAGLTKALSLRDFLRVNAGGIENLMQAADTLPAPPVVVFVSSLAAAGPARNGRPREPNEPPRPVSNYGKSKLAGEIAAAKFADRVPVSILRPPIVIGEGDLLTLGLFHTIWTFHFHLVPGLTPSRFSVVHVADLVQAIIVAAEQGRRIEAPRGSPEFETENGAVQAVNNEGRGIYYPADAEMPDFAEFGQLIARGLGRSRVLCVPTPRFGVQVSGFLGELAGQILRRPMPLNLDKAREAAAGSWTCSPRTANQELGFQPGAPLADRFRQTAQWYLQEGWL